MQRVVITGMGVIAALGDDIEIFFNRLLAGENGMAKQCEPELPCLVAATKFNASQYFSKLELLGLDRGAQFALCASSQAVKSSGIDASSLVDAGVYWGTGGGGFATLEGAYAKMHNNIMRASGSSLMIPSAMVHAPAAQISIRHKVYGECLTYSTACSSASVAIGEAWLRVASGRCVAAISGGSECPLLPGVIQGWLGMRVLCDDVISHGLGCRPFDSKRQGFYLGEAAAAFVLESLEHAQARGAPILAELVGYGASNDATHITRPDVNGQVRAIKNALKAAAIEPTEIGYVNAHGTGTQVGDAVECASLAAIFDESVYRPPVSSTKAAHGHTLGASGAIELMVSVQALRHQKLPPTLNWSGADTSTAGWDFIPDRNRSAQLDYAMSNSFAFGGNNTVLIVRRWID